MARNPSWVDKLITPSAKQEPSCFQQEEEEDGRQAVPAAAGSSAARATVRASSRPAWAGRLDPRIVRVSRALGGKDRHSKVSTVRGLRDRRVRLSVQTAIQLYDLQDRLGLSQPSKAVDWLLDAAQLEIDKLPPLQIPPGGSSSCFQLQYFPGAPAPPPSSPHVDAPPLGRLPRPPAATSSSRPLLQASAVISQIDQDSSTAGSSPALQLPGAGREGNYGARGHVEHQLLGQPLPRSAGNLQHQYAGAEVIPVHGNLHRLGFLSMLNGGTGGGGGGGGLTYGSYCLQLETPSVFALQTTHQLGGFSSAPTTAQSAAEEAHGYRPVLAPPSLSLTSHPSSQFLLCPSVVAAPSMFSPADYEPNKHGDGSSSTVFQLLGSSASSHSSKHHHFSWNGHDQSG